MGEAIGRGRIRTAWAMAMPPPYGGAPPPPPPGAGLPGQGVPGPAAPGPRSTGWAVATAVVVTLLVVVVVGGAFVLGRSGNDEAATTTTAPTTTVTTTAPPATTAPPTTAPPTTLGDVRTQPAGLFCRDLRSQGFSYSASVDYWRVNGQPDQMDADKDGIPCETAYPSGDVVAYWGTLGRSVDSDVDTSGVYGLPSGLLCRDLADRGYDVYEAIDYYLVQGLPDRMDADGNGIPCETVYPDAASAWFQVG